MGARSLLCKGAARNFVILPPMCSATTAVAKLSSVLQGIVAVATCAWPQATFAAQTWRVISSLAREKAASAVETRARLQAASVADRHTYRGVGGIQSVMTPSVHSMGARSMLCKGRATPNLLIVPPMCSATTAMAKLSSALQGIVVVATRA